MTSVDQKERVSALKAPNGVVCNAQGNLAYILSTLTLIATIVLSYVSWVRICTDSCAESHSYRLYGFTFESVGLLFFPLLLFCHLLSRKSAIFGVMAGWLLAATLGSEVMFLYIQKYVIGRW